MIRDLLSYEFLRLALFGTILVSFLAAFVSPIVVYRKMEFIGDGVAHATFAGLAVASILSSDAIFFGVLSSVIFALFVWYFSRKNKFSESSTIGVLLPVFMAFGVLLLSKSRSYTVDLSSYLFGNVLLVNKSDIFFAIGVIFFTIIVYLLFWRDITYYIGDEKAAKFYGIKVNLISLFIMFFVSFSVVATVKISGIILMGTYIVLPGVFAKITSKSFKGIILKSLLFSLVSSLTGFTVAYYFDLPPGPTIALTAFVALLITTTLKRK